MGGFVYAGRLDRFAGRIASLERSGTEAGKSVPLHTEFSHGKFIQPVASSIGREHDVDDYAADRDVEPNRESESGQTPVRGKATTEREKKSDENHRQGHDRETDVRDEQREVDVTNHARALKAHVAVEGVIGDVADEENGGKDKRRKHGRPVLADAPGTDEGETRDEGDGG